MLKLAGALTLSCYHRVVQVEQQPHPTAPTYLLPLASSLSFWRINPPCPQQPRRKPLFSMDQPSRSKQESRCDRHKGKSKKKRDGRPKPRKSSPVEAEEVPSDTFYKVKGTLQQKSTGSGSQYLIDWEDNLETGESFDPTWVCPSRQSSLTRRSTYDLFYIGAEGERYSSRNRRMGERQPWEGAEGTLFNRHKLTRQRACPWPQAASSPCYTTSTTGLEEASDCRNLLNS